MTNVAVVIGANYGDEGKGLVTDFLSKDKRTVIRFNGGAQAGHTVVTPDGKRHVFHHFGSGTLQGSDTYLSPYFVINPIIYYEELKEIQLLGHDPRVRADPHCPITTPYDMFINRAIEKKRGVNKHGSCGLGINETIKRTEAGFGLFFADIFRYGSNQKIIRNIKNDWVPKRLAELGLTEEDVFLIKDEEILDSYLNQLHTLVEEIEIKEWNKGINLKYFGDQVLFEGAQGLLLDKDSSSFPHVTNSKTGLHNVMQMLNWINYRGSLDAYYVSRTYVTRHGAGPLDHEVPNQEEFSKEVNDLTNSPNPNQGTMRYGYLDHYSLSKRIFLESSKYVTSDIKVNTNFVLTCADQFKDNLQIFDHGVGKGTPEYILSRIRKLDNAYISYGPTRDNIKKIA